MRLELVELEPRAEEGAHGQADAAQEMRAEDYPLAFLRLRRNLLLRRETDPHLVCAGQPPRLAEELDVILMDVGAVPIPAVLHRGVGLARMSVAAENRVVERCGGEALLQERAEGRRWRRGEGRVSACRFPLPLLIASHGEAKEARRGVRRGINCTHSPHAP